MWDAAPLLHDGNLNVEKVVKNRGEGRDPARSYRPDLTP
jgi:hypothetical protein